MAITEETLAAIGQARDGLGARLDATSEVLVARWVGAWDLLAPLYEKALAEVLADAAAAATAAGPGATTTPTWPARGRLLRYQRLLQALEATEGALRTLAELTQSRTAADAAAAAAAAPRDAAAIIATQLPAAAGSQAALVVAFGQLNPDALARIIARSTQQITALTRPLSDEATTAVTRELIKGVAIGRNSRQTAAAMLKGLEGRFNGGLTRALVIARTETGDAYLAAAHAADQENADVLRGWIWTAKLDARTCPSCWAQHGTKHETTDPGPLDHQCGRCGRAPWTKTWRELGYDIDEPESVMPDARAKFDALPEAEQLAVMGPTRLELLRSGKVAWSDLSTVRTNPNWRDSHAPTSVRVLRQTATRG